MTTPVLSQLRKAFTGDEPIVDAEDYLREVTYGAAFPTVVWDGRLHIFHDDVASGLVWQEMDGTALTNADDKDIARYNGTNWIKVGTLLGSASLTSAQAKTLYEDNDDTNAFTDTEQTKLGTVATNAAAVQTASQIKTKYEGNADTNAFTDAEKVKLGTVTTDALVPAAKILLLAATAVAAGAAPQSVTITTAIENGYLLEFQQTGAPGAVGYIVSDLLLAQTPTYENAPGVTAGGGLAMKIQVPGDGAFGHDSLTVWQDDSSTKLWLHNGRSAARRIIITAYPLGGEASGALSAMQVKTLYEGNNNTNAFTDVYKGNLDTLVGSTIGHITASRFGFVASRTHNLSSLGVATGGQLEDVTSSGLDAYILASNGIALDANTVTSVTKLNTETDVRSILNYAKGWTGAVAKSIAVVRGYGIVGWVNPTSGNSRLATHSLNTGALVSTLASNEGDSLEFLAAHTTENKMIECRRLANGTYRVRVISVAANGTMASRWRALLILGDLFGPVSATVRGGFLLVLQASGVVRAYALAGFARAATSDEYYSGIGFRGISSHSKSIEFIITSTNFVRFDATIGIHVPPPTLVVWSKNQGRRLQDPGLTAQTALGNFYTNFMNFGANTGAFRWKAAPSELFFGAESFNI